MQTSDTDRRDGATKRIHDQRHFKLQLAIFVLVNTLLVLVFAIVTIAGAHVVGELWPWPVVTALWGARVAIQGYAVYHIDRHA